MGTDAEARRNPDGEGVLVYVPRTRFWGVERKLVWLVIDGQAFPLNGASATVTPSLPWPREAPEGVWKKTGLDPYQATKTIELLWGKS